MGPERALQGRALAPHVAIAVHETRVELRETWTAVSASKSQVSALLADHGAESRLHRVGHQQRLRVDAETMVLTNENTANALFIRARAKLRQLL